MDADYGNAAEHVLAVPLELAVVDVGDKSREMFGDGALGGGNGHRVVVQNDRESSPGGVVVQGLQRQPARHGAISYDGDDLMILAFGVPGGGQAQGDRNGGSGVPDGIAVIGALLGRGIAG